MANEELRGAAIEAWGVRVALGTAWRIRRTS